MNQNALLAGTKGRGGSGRGVFVDKEDAKQKQVRTHY